VRCLIAILLGAGLLSAQPDARELVRQSIRNGERSWKESLSYFCIKEEIDRQLGPKGAVRSLDDDVYEVRPLGYGSFFELHIKHDNEPLSRAEQAKAKQELARRQAETPAQKQRRMANLIAERSYMKEVPDAFDFKITGEENLPTGPAWVVEATPRPGYHARSRYARMFPNMRGKLWIDKHDVQWVKADAVAMNTVSFGLFIARLSKGSHIVLEQQKLPDGDWVARRIQAKADARMFIFFNHNFEEDIRYTDYRKGSVAVASAK